MPKTQSRAVMNWILAFGSFAVFLVVYGGFVRLTRSGLSIVDWNPVMGVVPPLTQPAWQIEFEKYQLSPEYRQINFDMTLEQYQEIFVIEWLHRILARLAGLLFAVPFFVFLLTKRIPWREAGPYVVMGALFLAQAIMGWLMVASGLVDQPAVSHFLLTAHLFLALSLIGLSLWIALGHHYGFRDQPGKRQWSAGSRAVLVGLLALLIQIAYGGFTAGLKAGHVSDTWPLMLGHWIPGGLLRQVEPALANLVSAPLTVAWIHRWFAIAILVCAFVIYRAVDRRMRGAELAKGVGLLLALTTSQIGLGIAVVLSHVEIGFALLHQLNAIGLFTVMIFLLHRLRSQDRVGPAKLGTG